MPAPVDDRTVLMRTTETNLEPILLVHEGTDRLRELVDDATRSAPLADFVALDGSGHRLWAIDSAECHTRDRRRARRRHRAHRRRPPPLRRLPGPPGGAARRGHAAGRLALGLRPRDARRPARPGAPGRPDPPLRRRADDVGPAGPLPTSAATSSTCTPTGRPRSPRSPRAADAGPASFVVSDGHAWAVLRVKRTHEVDAAVLHETLLPGLARRRGAGRLPPQPRPGAARHHPGRRPRGRRPAALARPR